MELFDLVIKNGMVVDGTGNPYFRNDIAIKDEKIVKIGKVKGQGKININAEGTVVSPGFIDLHNHSDMTILAYPNAESYIMQGVTTAVVGNCGISMAPVNSDNLELLKRYVSPFLPTTYDYKWDWKTIKEFYEKVEEQGTTINLVPLVGHGTIRLAVKGFDPGEPSNEEMEEMKNLLRQSLDEGVFGMSTGLIYPPGSYATTEEIIELAKVVKEYGAIYATHMRDEAKYLIEAVEEAIRIGEEADVPVEISHHKAAGKSNWGKVYATLRLMEKARKRGLEVNCDVYPYTAGSTTVTALLPTWALEGGIDKMLERLKDKEIREKIKTEIEEDTMTGENFLKNAGWEGVLISQCSKKEYEGKTLEEILKEKGRLSDPYEELLDWLLEVKGDAAMVVFTMDEEDVKTVISHPLSSIISDSWATTPTAGGKPHPRAYGTFPRVIRKYVREEKLLSLEEAIRKMTSLPAGKIRLQDRGLIKEGFWADIVIFNPDKIRDKATYRNPHQYPEGIKYVIVNGQIVVESGKLTGRKPGKVIKRLSKG